MHFIHLGFGNELSAERAILLATPNSAPVRRLIKANKEKGKVIDISSNKGVLGVVFTDSGHIILTHLSPKTMVERSDMVQRGEKPK